MAKNTNHKKEVVEAYNKELDRDIINMSLPEIDWSEPPTGYPENFDELIDKYRKARENDGRQRDDESPTSDYLSLKKMIE